VLELTRRVSSATSCARRLRSYLGCSYVPADSSLSREKVSVPVGSSGLASLEELNWLGVDILVDL
jgi:hypothetical protein